MEVSRIAERCGNFVQIYDTVQNVVIKRLPYTKENFNLIIREARKYGREEYERNTGKKIPVKRVIKRLPKVNFTSKLDEGVTTMDYILPTEDEVVKKMGQASARGKYFITFRPTDKTEVKMGLTHGPFKINGVTIENAKRKYNLQFVEIHNNEPKIISDEPCKDIVDAIRRFIKQIDFCCKMYGRVQKTRCEWIGI